MAKLGCTLSHYSCLLYCRKFYSLQVHSSLWMQSLETEWYVVSGKWDPNAEVKLEDSYVWHATVCLHCILQSIEMTFLLTPLLPWTHRHAASLPRGFSWESRRRTTPAPFMCARTQNMKEIALHRQLSD